MHTIRQRLGLRLRHRRGAYDAPPDQSAGEEIGAYCAYCASILVPAAPRFCRTIFMSVAPPLGTAEAKV